MDSLIKNDGHISNTVNNMGPYRALRGRVNGLGYSSNERLMPYLELAEFGSIALVRTFDLWYDLISTLVNRWRSETHTFHLPCRECTVTLEDVALQLELPINGSAVTGISAIAEPVALCYSLLKVSHADAESNFTSLKFSWLKANFEHLSINATEHENVRSYSWVSTVLAMLYCELFRTTKPDSVDIGGCLLLLQSWALYQMSFLASVRHQPYIFPLVNRWSFYLDIGRSYTVSIYRLMIVNSRGRVKLFQYS
ncbi:protein MAINTENANCE OF MERISTEMS-like [Gossypium raimondii]|uniref:protein MAINTENANCE OF MERISTEMS-like n=1 Tax=Gossypium raimondii TaxID=29730 RepID=UPI00063ACBB2|nr:protein MAINTENANCE OF MERISTEMS-like [Gossypium raimondii]